MPPGDGRAFLQPASNRYKRPLITVCFSCFNFVLKAQLLSWELVSGVIQAPGVSWGEGCPHSPAVSSPLPHVKLASEPVPQRFANSRWKIKRLLWTFKPRHETLNLGDCMQSIARPGARPRARSGSPYTESPSLPPAVL